MFEKKFELRKKNSYPKILNDEIKLLSFNKENSVLIGSASYKIQKYPADIDLYEQIKTCCNKEEAIEFFQLGIQNIVNNIRLKNHHWMIEVKCGKDDRYDIEKIDKKNMQLFLKKNIGILSDSDYKKLKLYTDFLDRNDAEEELINEIIRNYSVIRWSTNDILLGWKVKYGKKFYLRDCIDTISPINIEVIAIVNDKFTDLSNFFVLIFHDKLTDKDYLVNFPQEYLTESRKFVVQGLKDGINKVLFSKINKDVFKGIKRMYSLSRLTLDDKLFYKIKDIINGDLAQLSQLKSELATLLEIIEFTDEIPWKVFYDHLESIKWRIGGNLYIDDNQLNTVINGIDNILFNKYDIPYIKDTLDFLKKYLLLIVNNEATKYLLDNKLYVKF